MKSRTPHRLPAAAVLSAVLVSAAFVTAQEPEEVDFGLPPAAGLTFRVTDEQRSRGTGTIAVGGEGGEVRLTQSITATETYTQTVLEVERGRVVALERAYEDAGQQVVVQTPIAPDSPAIERSATVAWKRFRARWTDGEPALDVREDGGWKEAGNEVRSHLPGRALREPIAPLPAARKRVGDSWELDGRALRAYFRSGGPIAGEPSSPLDGSARFTLTGFESRGGDRCAVIAFEMRIGVESGGDAYAFSLGGRIHYSLRHRIAVGMQGEGPLEVASDREPFGRAVRIRLRGTRTMRRSVQVLDAGAGEAERSD